LSKVELICGGYLQNLNQFKTMCKDNMGFITEMKQQLSKARCCTKLHSDITIGRV